MDSGNLSIVIFVKEEFLPRQALAFADNGRYSPVRELNFMKLTTLPPGNGNEWFGP